MSASILTCVRCPLTYAIDAPRVRCDCGSLLDVQHDLSYLKGLGTHARALFGGRRTPGAPEDRSGVWRFRELVLPDMDVRQLVTRQEGNTRLYTFPKTSRWLQHTDVRFKHEGENPTGSFKDRGLTVAVTMAKRMHAKTVICASTGNTAAAVASYASLAGMQAVILLPEKATALGKVAQALAYGAITLFIRGDFDDAMRLVLEVREDLGVTVLNSVNPFRLEGQKTIIFEILEELGWQVPDWIVVPGGNLGNTSAFGKALHEAHTVGLIDRLPRLAVVQAEGANPFYRSSRDNWRPHTVEADTLATAIRIGAPVNFEKAVRSIVWTDGVVTQVTDVEIMDAKAVLDSDGVGAEPASCASVAGIRKLRKSGIIRSGESVVGILTGHFLKDPDATIGYHKDGKSARGNRPLVIDPTLEAIKGIVSF